VLVCDAYHAMTSTRPYREALAPKVARAELRRHAGTQFCPTTVAAALAVLEPDAPAPAADRGGAPDGTPADLARAHDEIAESHEQRARGHALRDKHSSAAISRRKAAEHREQARQARAEAAEQRR
jgi:hypothetical protein